MLQTNSAENSIGPKRRGKAKTSKRWKNKPEAPCQVTLVMKCQKKNNVTLFETNGLPWKSIHADMGANNKRINKLPTTFVQCIFLLFLVLAIWTKQHPLVPRLSQVTSVRSSPPSTHKKSSSTTYFPDPVISHVESIYHEHVQLITIKNVGQTVTKQLADKITNDPDWKSVSLEYKSAKMRPNGFLKASGS